MTYKVKPNGTIEADTAREAVMLARLLAQDEQPVAMDAVPPTVASGQVPMPAPVVNVPLPSRENVFGAIQQIVKTQESFLARDVAKLLGCASGRAIGIALGQLRVQGVIKSVEHNDRLHQNLWQLVDAAAVSNPVNGTPHRPSLAVKHDIRVGQVWERRNGKKRQIRIEKLNKDNIVPKALMSEYSSNGNMANKKLTYRYLMNAYKRVQES